MSDKDMPSHHGVETPTKKNGDIYPNETMKLLLERASCRDYSDKKIPDDVLENILEAGCHAPTGGNLQPYSIIKIEKEETRQGLAKLCMQPYIAQAPVNLIFCIDWHRIERWAKVEVSPFTATASFRHFWISFQDTVICAQNICTAADSFGLGSVYIGTILDFVDECRKLFQLPKGVFPVVLLCLGYPKGKLIQRKKLTVNAIVHEEEYKELSDQEIRDVFNEKYPDLKVKITKERLEVIYRACTQVHGEQFAAKCMEKIEDQGYINPVQRYFGLHYVADVMPQGNEDFLRIMRESGFQWFQPFQPKARDDSDNDQLS